MTYKDTEAFRIMSEAIENSLTAMDDKTLEEAEKELHGMLAALQLLPDQFNQKYLDGWFPDINMMTGIATGLNVGAAYSQITHYIELPLISGCAYLVDENVRNVRKAQGIVVSGMSIYTMYFGGVCTVDLVARGWKAHPILWLTTGLTLINFIPTELKEGQGHIDDSAHQMGFCGGIIAKVAVDYLVSYFWGRS